MTETITVKCPWPPAVLSPNSREHWAPKSVATGKYRYWCKMAAIAEGVRGLTYADPLPVRVTFRPPTARKIDLDNRVASFKAGQDGIAEAMGVDDATFEPTYALGGKLKGGAVFVTFEGVAT